MLSRYVNRDELRIVRRLLPAAHRQYATQAELQQAEKCPEASTYQQEIENARPFECIPGPSLFEFLRNMLPGGLYFKMPIADMILKLEQQYGPIFRLPAMFGTKGSVTCMNPADFSTVFRNEGIWPHRLSLDSWVYHRQVHRREFFQGVQGLVSSYDEEWAKVRTAVNPILMQPKYARLYLNNLLEVNDEFLLRIREIRNPETLEMPVTFEDEINRMAFESVAAVALNTQLGLIRKNRDSPESKIIIESVKKFFDLSYDLDVMPSIWRIVKTPKFYQMMKTLDVLTDTCNKYIDEALAKIEHDAGGKQTSEVGKEKSVVEKLARIDKKLAVVMALDMMMAGVDTTSSTLVGILFGIAKNPEKQQKLFEELKTIMPHKDSRLSIENMSNLPYLRASIKEGIRRYPIIVGTSRRLPKDIVLSGYRVVKGTDVAICSNLQLLKEQYVPRANEFLPERWLRSDVEGQKVASALSDPFLYLPFGFGPRSCVGKRIVDMELEITVASLVRNFNIEFNYSLENAYKSRLINVPAIPLQYKFEERAE